MSTQRNYGIDLLRLVAMFFVVMLHVLGQGGILAHATGIPYALCWLFEIVAYCAVDCYAIISGYVCYREEETPYRYSNYLAFWVPVFVYSFGITLVGYLLRPDVVETSVLVRSVLPVASAQYWYVNAYTGLFFLIPWLNRLLRHTTAAERNRLVLLLFAVFSVYATFSNAWNDVFRLIGGYSFVWLVLLYIVGAWIKCNRIDEKKSSLWWCCLFVGCALLTWGDKMLRGDKPPFLVSYVSFPVVLMALSLVVLFSRLRFPAKGIAFIRMFSPAAFGVYLIHTQTLIWKHSMADAFVWVASCQVRLLPLAVFGCVFAIFSVCLAIELLRQTVFRVLRLNQLIQWIQARCDAAGGRLVHRICG